MKNILSIAALAAIASAGAIEGAAANLIQDPFFESSYVQYGSAYAKPVSPWSIVGSYGDDPLHSLSYPANGYYTNAPPPVITGAPFTNPGGNVGQQKFFWSDVQSGYTGVYIFQTVSGLTVGKTYLLSFDQAGNSECYEGPSSCPSTNTAYWEVVAGAPGTPNWTGALISPTINIPQSNDVSWDEVSFAVTATSATEQFSFMAQGAGAPPFALITDVSLLGSTGGIPEPATWAMMGLGFAGLGFAAYRRRTIAARAVA